jgi:hypothetical protein
MGGGEGWELALAEAGLGHPLPVALRHLYRWVGSLELKEYLY